MMEIDRQEGGSMAGKSQPSRAAPGESLAELAHIMLQTAANNPHTRRAYRTALGLFLQYLDRERGMTLPPAWRPLAEATTDSRRTVWTYRGDAGVLRLVDVGLLDGFRAWREAEGDRPSAAAARWTAVRSCLSVAARLGVLALGQSQALGLKAWRERSPSTASTRSRNQPAARILTSDEVRRLLAAARDDTIKGHRDRAILDILLYLGLRRNEVASLELRDFQREGEVWWVEIAGLAGRQRRLKVHPAILVSLTGWLADAGLELGGNGPVFLSVNKGGHVAGHPLQPGMIARLVAEYGQAAGLAPLAGPERLSPRDLRRTCARNAHDHGANLLLVQALLGHRDPRMTARYIGASEPEASTAVDYVRY